MSMAEIQVRLGERSYPVIVQRNLSARIVEVLEKWAPSGRYFIVTDTGVWPLYEQLFPKDRSRFPVFAVQAGEKSKSIQSLESLWTFLLGHGVERSHVVVSFGGGVVGDLAGFAAATVLRGVRLVQIPTTLLAQVDAAIGGKTGVNHPLGKNLLGAFHQPVVVLADPAFLATLPESEFQSGMYEVIKYSLIEKTGLYERLAGKAWTRQTDLTSIIEQCVQCKAEIVAADERESGRRMVLNFGHTLGHAIETAAGFLTFTHGQAIGWGMIFAARLSRAMEICSESTRQAVERLVHQNGELPAVKSAVEPLMDIMARDKKVCDGLFTFILPRTVGEVVVRKGVPPELVQKQLGELLS